MDKVYSAPKTLFTSSFEELQSGYKNIQIEASNLIREILTDTEMFKKLLKVAGDDGLIEIGHAFGNGNDGSGYYTAHLMLSLRSKESDEEIISLIIKYVPETDREHDWDIKEFSEITECNFAKAYVLLSYMQVFISYHSCRLELFRLSERKYSTCVMTVDSAGLSFI